MKRRYLAIALVATLAVAFGAIASACDGGGDTLTLEEFFQEIQALDDDLETQSTELEAQFDELSEENSIEDVGELFREFGALIEDFVDGLSDLNPPDEAADVHEEAVSAGRAVVDAFDNVIDDAEDAESIEDFFTVFEDGDFSAAQERFDQACLDAEQLAADNDITVDFDCDEE